MIRPIIGFCGYCPISQVAHEISRQNPEMASIIQKVFFLKDTYFLTHLQYSAGFKKAFNFEDLTYLKTRPFIEEFTLEQVCLNFRIKGVIDQQLKSINFGGLLASFIEFPSIDLAQELMMAACRRNRYDFFSELLFLNTFRLFFLEQFVIDRSTYKVTFFRLVQTSMHDASLQLNLFRFILNHPVAFDFFFNLNGMEVFDEAIQSLRDTSIKDELETIIESSPFLTELQKKVLVISSPKFPF
jgi:hypothetical protein